MCCCFYSNIEKNLHGSRFTSAFFFFFFQTGRCLQDVCGRSLRRRYVAAVRDKTALFVLRSFAFSEIQNKLCCVFLVGLFVCFFVIIIREKENLSFEVRTVYSCYNVNDSRNPCNL